MQGSNESRVKRIYVFQPQYGSGVSASHRQFWRGTGSRYPRCSLVEGGGSLLANSFNQAWVHALNLQESGDHITNFAMLHDDIVPADGWLDQLLDDLLEAQDADPTVAVMSAVVPIKDPLGLTSTAIDGDDEFSVLRRLSMTEVFDLPEVFSAADCGYPERFLLVNTGCWVCDFGQPWRLATDSNTGQLLAHFTIRDRIRRLTDPVSGVSRWVAEVAPEDWNFSRAVQRQGYQVRATRRVRLAHHGTIPYNNTEPWGELTSDALLEHRHGGKKVGKEGCAHAVQPVHARGWLTDGEGAALARHATGKTVLEIGSYCGRSTIWMARTAEMVYAVDTFDSRNTPPDQSDKRSVASTLDEFIHNLRDHGVLGRVKIRQGLSAAIVSSIIDEFDMAFIDGSHDAASVNEDVASCRTVLKPDGLLAFHDYNSQRDYGVTAVVNHLIDEGAEVVDRVDSLIVLRLQSDSSPREHTSPHSSSGVAQW